MLAFTLYILYNIQMRNNIYSLEPLPGDIRDAVHDGIGQMAVYIGETITSKEFCVKLPTNESGRVKSARVGTANFDIMTELHTLVVPLDSAAGRLGESFSGTGVLFVDPSSKSPEVIRTTAAHEAAHSLSFVDEETGHSMPNSPTHCQREKCIMFPDVFTEERVVEEMVKRRTLLDRIVGRCAVTEPKRLVAIANGQFDFCNDCKTDMRELGQRNLSELRYARLLSRKILPGAERIVINSA